MLAGEILPTTLDRALYLDPDILVINSLLDLWHLDLKDHVFAAASHTGLTDASTRINQLRLDMDHAYFNSGVLLINLTQARLKIHWADIQDTLDKYNNFLLLPDQDVLNYLYGKYTLEIPEEIWNYDARKYLRYLARSMNRLNIHWVLGHTSVLHFCGQPKPWQEEHDNRFTGLYLDYQKRIDHLLKNNTIK
ncbi:glycosyltransferase family 8 protein [Hutsoniella sourekii]